jgi:hypothetical protein
MIDYDSEWVRRHVALMRTQPGHWCSVKGCTGSQPLHWVPTELEVRAERQPRGRAIDYPIRAPLVSPRHAWRRGIDHIHWAGR